MEEEKWWTNVPRENFWYLYQFTDPISNVPFIFTNKIVCAMTTPYAAVTADPVAAESPPNPSHSSTIKPENSTIPKRRKKRKEKPSICPDSASSSSSHHHQGGAGFKVSRITKGLTYRTSSVYNDVDVLAVCLGTSLGLFLAQVLERQSHGGNMSADYMSKTCVMAVRESVANMSGNKFDSFLTIFEKVFQSTLMTHKVTSESPQYIGEQPQRLKLGESSCSVASTKFTLDELQEPVGPTDTKLLTHDQSEENIEMDVMSRQLVLSDGQTEKLSLMEKARSNNLKTIKIALTQKKLDLKERELDLMSDSNFLGRWNLSMGFSKASFKTEKFKTQLQDKRQAELRTICTDLLVAGLVIMLASLSYGTYVYSYRRLVEATEACSPPSGSSTSWWMPKSVSTFSTGWQLVNCQLRVFSRMLFGTILIASIAVLLIKRSSSSHNTMPVTFILLLLGVVCGYAGRFCIYALGGNGNRWFLYWEAFCSLHFISNMFHSALFLALNGPITMAEKVRPTTVFPYWTRHVLFYTTLVVLPLLCGLMPFAGPGEWFNHFASRVLSFGDDLED